MRIEEIKGLRTTLNIDPDEARILAAACQAAATVAEGSQPNDDVLAAFGEQGLVGMLLEGYAALFEAASMAGAAHDALTGDQAEELSLSGIRAHGTGARFVNNKSENNKSEETR